MLILNEQLIQSIYKIEDAIRDVEAILVIHGLGFLVCCFLLAVCICDISDVLSN
jgi:hypothetical protein